MALENLVSTVKAARDTCKSKIPEGVYNYCVDVVSGWAYYTPVYAIQEAACGKDFETIVKTRLVGLAAHAIAMRPIGLLRNYIANKMQVTKDSSFLDKLKVNVLSVTPPQAIVYGGMLAAGNALSGNYDAKSSLLAWGVGVGLGALHAFPYGVVQDKIRGACGVKPAIQQKIQ